MKTIEQLRSERIGKKDTREIQIDTREINQDTREVDLAFSSETEVERLWGIEVLSHIRTDVDMVRLNNSAPLLLQHDPDRQIGVVEIAEIHSDKRGRAKVRFSNGPLGEEIFRDVVDGIRSLASVGYIINDVRETGERDGVPIYRVSWEPIEISIVAVPADVSVGVGRGVETTGETAMDDETTKAPIEYQREETNDTGQDDQSSTIASLEADLEHSRVESHIRKIGKHFSMDELAESYILLGRSLEDFQTAVFNAKRAELKPVPVESPENTRIEIPRRRTRMKAFPNTRDGEEVAFRAGQWALAAVFGNARAARWCKDHGVRVMTGTSSSTSSIVPDEMVLPIIDLRESYGIARQYCRIVPMGSDTANVPRRTSGVTAYFPGREDATPASDMAFDDVNLVAREVAALTRISRAYAADSAIDLADALAREMAYAFAVKEDACLFNGDGSAAYGGIYGIRAKIIDGNHTAGAVDAASGHDTFAEIDNDDLVGLTGALPEFPGIMPRWYSSKRGNALVFDALKAAAGGNTLIDLGSGPEKAYLGDPIVITQSMPSVITDLSNVAMLIYGDLDMGVTFGDRQGFEIEVLRERYAEYRQIGIQAVERMDIVVHGLGDTSNAGPVVALVGE